MRRAAEQGEQRTGTGEVSEEKRLTVYTSHKQEVYAPIIKEFEERTGIWVEVVPGGTTELLERIREEGEKGSCDVMFGGGVESYESLRTASCHTRVPRAIISRVYTGLRIMSGLRLRSFPLF